MTTISAGTTTTTGLICTSDTTGVLTFSPANGTSVFNGTGYAPTTTLTDGATINWATTTSQVAVVTLGGNRTFAAPTGLVNGAFYALAVYQDATGGRTLAWNTVFKWNAGSAPTLSTAANAKDFFVFRSDGTNLYEQGRALGDA